MSVVAVSVKNRTNIASHFFDLVIGKILTSRLIVSKHVAYNLGNLFFFQAEDGIRDYKVTGVQTCALPIFPLTRTRPVFCGRSSGGLAPVEGRAAAPELRPRGPG